MDESESSSLFHIDGKHFQHGLRHGDFQRYRKYCRDKIRRIRRTLTNNRKSKHNFQKLELVENTKCDLSTKWEAKAYYHWAMSTLNLSQKKWEESLNFVCRSDMKSAYQNRIEELSVSEKYCTYSLKGSENSEELKKIYSSINSSEFDAQLSGVLSEARQNTESSIEINWLDRKYYVQARKVKEFLLNLREKELRLSELAVNQSFDSKLEFFDKYLLDCKEALQELSDLIHSEKKPTYLEEQFTTQRDLEEIQTYINFLKLSLSSERNEVIFQDLYSKYLMINKVESSTRKSSTKRTDNVRPEHFIRIFDQLIQNTNEMSGLSGVSSDDFKRRVHARSLNVYNACRCYFGSILMQSETRYKDGVCLLYKSLEYFNLAKLVEIDESVDSEFTKNLIIIFEEKALSLKINLDICSLSNSGFIIKDTALEKINWPDIYCDVESLESDNQPDSNIQDKEKQSQGFASYVKSWIWRS
ncbi:hypothetical protein MXB_4384 [Myxobolus squamalis]|nr:hypothetical protein MXB_4384 [Myxobolus squamalis]